MYNEQLLNILLNKIPDILLSVFIFITFFIIAKIFERLVLKVLNKKNTKIAISKVIAGIVKNILVIVKRVLQAKVFLNVWSNLKIFQT